MSESVGKYRILERIGRGGMGTVFKAHDDILNRLVALKILSGEIEVTGEVKARFYREARACAKLNHRNVIVVYDLGEEGDRLFIVMELLEGEELRSIIAQRTAMPLEQKLSLMIQVCDGLHYAHEHGVIHRDIKPGNIFVLRNGQVKILDFGIARIAASDSGLTRTGFIMGTLRYMSPEQARGRVDHRSDIFSVGSVFYELLTFRPPFDGDNPIEILEQLRTTEPPPITELDPTLPPELARIIERALRKDPAERFPDLGQMRAELERVRHQLTEEADRLHGRVRDQVNETRTLRAGLVARLGESVEDLTLPAVDAQAPVAALHALEADLNRQLEALRGRWRHANAVEPVLAQGLERLRDGNHAAAIDALEEVLREIPGHPKAQAALEQARAGAASARAGDTPEEPVAVAASETGADAAPGPIPAASTAAPADLVPIALDPELATPRPAPAGAPWLRPGLEPRSRRLAAAATLLVLVGGAIWAFLRPSGAPEPRPTVGLEAPSTVSPAPGGSPSPAASAPSAELDPTPPEALETARQGMLGARDAAAAAGAEQRRPALWGPAAELATAAEAATARRDFAEAQAAYRRAQEAYERAASGARLVADVEGAREDSTRARQAAEATEAATLVPPAWTRAVSLEREAEEAVTRDDLEAALTRYRTAGEAYRDAEGAATKRAAAATRERERLAALKRRAQATEQLASAVATARREAEQAGADRLAAQGLARGQDNERAGQAALGRREYAVAEERFRDAQQEYERARQDATEAEKGQAEAQAKLERDAQEARTQMAEARGLAEQANAKRLAPKLWAEATVRETEAQRALERREPRVAQQRFVEARQEYRRASQAAQQEAAREAERRRTAEQLRERMQQARSAAERVDARRLAPTAWAEATAREAEATAALGRKEVGGAAERFRAAGQSYERAGAEAQQAAEAAKRAAASRAAPAGPEAAQGRAASPVPGAGSGAESQPGRAPGFGETLLGAMRQVFADKLRGVSGPVAWEIADTRTEELPVRREIRWHYTLVLKETAGTAIQFSRLVHTAGRGEARALMTEEPFRQRLAAGSTLRLSRSEVLTYGSEPGAEALARREGVTVWWRYVGTDDAGKEVVVDVRFRL